MQCDAMQSLIEMRLSVHRMQGIERKPEKRSSYQICPVTQASIRPHRMDLVMTRLWCSVTCNVTREKKKARGVVEVRAKEMNPET
eukprot:jgi/Psemu1/316161/fgenesh1_kg.2889_\